MMHAGGAADRLLVVSEHGTLLVDSMAEVRRSRCGDNVGLAGDATGRMGSERQALGERTTPVPRKVLAVVELHGDAAMVVRQRRVFPKFGWERVEPSRPPQPQRWGWGVPPGRRTTPTASRTWAAMPESEGAEVSAGRKSGGKCHLGGGFDGLARRAASAAHSPDVSRSATAARAALGPPPLPMARPLRQGCRSSRGTGCDPVAIEPSCGVVEVAAHVDVATSRTPHA